MRMTLRSRLAAPALAVLCLALAGCATPASRYYSLTPAAAGPSVATDTAAGAPFLLSLQPVRVPEQVDRPQIVVGTTRSDALTLLNDSLWSAPLPEELRRAVSLRLTARLGTIDLLSADLPPEQPAWKIFLTVNRFESLYQDAAVLDVTWRLVPTALPNGQVQICRATLQAPAGSSIDSLVQAHQTLAVRLADILAAQLVPGAAPADASFSAAGCTVVREKVKP